MVYEYTRSLVNGIYDVHNIVRVDGSSNQIQLRNEILVALPAEGKPKMKMNGSSLSIAFSGTLSAGDETTLESVVTDHKNNS